MARKAWHVRRPRDSYHWAFILGVFSALVLLLICVVAFTHEQGGLDSVRSLLRSAGLGAIAMFTLLIVSNQKQHWIWTLAWWLVGPIAMVLLATFHDQWGLPSGSWIPGLGVGGAAGNAVVLFRRRRRVRLYPAGPVLLVPRGRRVSRPVSSRLTLTGFREALAVMDGGQQSLLALVNGDARLIVCGDPADRMVVYYTPDSDDERAWRRVASFEGDGLDNEVEVQVGGGLAGFYRRGSTVTVDVARRAGEYFIRHQGADPGLVWEDGEDVHARLPPIHLETP